MSLSQQVQQKNAPITLPADRATFLKWALEQPDTNITIGVQTVDPRLAVEAPSAHPDIAFYAAHADKTGPVTCGKAKKNVETD